MTSEAHKIWISGDLLAEKFKDVMINIQDGRPLRKAPMIGFMASVGLEVSGIKDLTGTEIGVLSVLLEEYAKKSGDIPKGLTLSAESRKKVFLKAVIEKKKEPKPETKKTVKKQITLPPKKKEKKCPGVVEDDPPKKKKRKKRKKRKYTAPSF